MVTLDLVVFDLAGTTVQATDQVAGAFRSAFQQYGMTVSEDAISSVRGRSKREAITELVESRSGVDDPAAIAAGVYREFRRTLMQRYEQSDVDVVEGAVETFSWLRSRGVAIALSTGFDRLLANLLLERVGWTQTIDAVVCNDDVPRGRPAPYLIYRAMEWLGCDQAGKVAAVGDTVSDLQAAHNAGIGRGIGVLSGAHSRAQLEACPHTTIIDSVKDLPSILASD